MATESLVGGDGFALFDTAVGTCGVAWTNRGIAGVQLPEGDPERTRARLRVRFPRASEGPMTAIVASAVDDIVALLRGERVDLASIAVDMAAVPLFDRAVYAAARAIPCGKTLTYGAIALQVGRPGAARDVGVALARNPIPIVVPCHRVVAANGKTGGFSASGGVATKLKLLAIEGGAGPLFDD